MDTGDVEAMQAMSRKNVRARRVSFQDRGNDSPNLEHHPEERTQLPSYGEGLKDEEENGLPSYREATDAGNEGRYYESFYVDNDGRYHESYVAGRNFLGEDISRHPPRESLYLNPAAIRELQEGLRIPRSH